MVAAKPLTWQPHAGQQTKFMSSPAYEALFGGAAGPGKTDCLVMEALRQVDNPEYNAILFRRVFTSLEAADGMIARSQKWYPAYGGVYNASNHVWKFPSGARIYFAHMQHEHSKLAYQGAQFSYIAFDELTEFTESQYMYMMTRNRAAANSGLRVYIRAATNPGGPGHEWVKKRFITKDIYNQVKYFATLDDEDVQVDPSHKQARSRAFYPASLSDNPSIGEDYEIQLKNDTDSVRRAQLLEGDWDAEYKDGLVYQSFSIEHNVTDKAEYNPDLRTIWCVDDGYAYGRGPGTESYHPRIVLVAQVNELGGLNIVNEYVECGVPNYETTIDNVLSMGYGEPEIAFIDSSAVMFKGALWNAGIAATGATHRVSEGIKNVRRMIQDAKGMRLLKVHPRCQYTIYEFGKYKASSNKQASGGEPKPEKVNDHAMDALRYGAWFLRFGE